MGSTIMRTHPGVGTCDSASNLFATGPGKLAVRGGSQVKQTLNCDRALYLRPFTPTGAVAVAHTDGATKHHFWRLTSDLAFFAATEVLSETDLTPSWDKATPARPVGAELFEKMFLCDATVAYATRAGLVSVDSNGTKTDVSFDLGGGAEQLRPYVCEEYNNHLFIAGYENKALGVDAPATVRHSYLGISPEAVGGFDPLAYEYIGAKGQRVTGMKKGRGLLLVAKPNELYRITGFGVAKPGWTFTTEMIQNTQGLGVSNPYALCYAGAGGYGMGSGYRYDPKGYWYGIGEAGIFRTDGFTTDLLVQLRRRSWPKITNLAASWVAFHPDRNAVLFGMVQSQPPAGRSTVYPTIVWVWDCQREVWISDIQMSADLMYAHAIPTTTTFGPQAMPSALAFTHASAALTTVAATWTDGDAGASTEFWVRDNAGGASVLWSTQAPTVAAATLTGLTQGIDYKVKIRHIKSGIASDFTAEVDAYTLLPTPPSCGTGSRTQTTVNVGAAALVNTATRIYFERDGNPVNDQAVTAIGTYDFNDTGLTCNTSYTWRARIYSSNWPVVIQYSGYASTGPVLTAPC